MTDDDRRWSSLWHEATKLSSAQITLLEKQLQTDQVNLDIRVQLFSYYNSLEGNHLKHKNAEQKLFEQVKWLISNKPALSPFLGTRVGNSALRLKPKNFAKLRELWFEQVSANPLDGTILGFAALFISWNDYETGSRLFEGAAALQPSYGWLGWLVIFCNAQLDVVPSLYHVDIRKQVVDIGVRSLRAEPDGAILLTCEYVCDAALILRQFDVVHFCAKFLRNWGCTQIANAYLGLVALREGNRELAAELMLKDKSTERHSMFRLARELFDLGERESIVQFITILKKRIKASERKRWLEQIANGETPDFEDYCDCS